MYGNTHGNTVVFTTWTADQCLSQHEENVIFISRQIFILEIYQRPGINPSGGLQVRCNIASDKDVKIAKYRQIVAESGSDGRNYICKLPGPSLQRDLEMMEYLF